MAHRPISFISLIEGYCRMFGWHSQFQRAFLFEWTDRDRWRQRNALASKVPLYDFTAFSDMFSMKLHFFGILFESYHSYPLLLKNFQLPADPIWITGLCSFLNTLLVLIKPPASSPLFPPNPLSLSPPPEFSQNLAIVVTSLLVRTFWVWFEFLV